MKGFLSRVANGQRLGMKMKLHCERPFAAPAKLATSGATNGNLPVRRGAGRLKNNKGALRMNVGMRVRGGLFAALILVAMPVAATVAAALMSSPAAAQTASSIAVEGNRRVEVETIRSYFKPGPGGRLDQGRIDDGLKALIETGLFQDVRINQAGGRLVVTVVENPVIGRMAFEGNKKVKDEQLSAEIQSKPRGTLSRPMVQSDAQRIAEIYRRSGRYDVRVNPEIIEQPNNRVDLIFTITEGSKTGVKSIEFIGNVAVSSYRLRDIIKTRESNLLSFLGGGDTYDPDRVEADRDLIRRYYLKRGFADVQVVAALTEYDPQKGGFLVTFKIEEGQQYRVGSVEFQSSIPTLDGNSLRSFSRVSVGSVYNAEALEKSVEEMQIEASRRGYAFAAVRPRGDRNFEAHTVSIVFAIDEGARTYIERINIRGNTRTRDYVIRREFDVSEGDAYNRALVDRSERRLKNLDFFKSVKISTEPGSSTRSRDPRGGSGREIHRRLLGVRRLLDLGRRAGRSQHLRTQFPRPRHVRESVGAVRPVCARRLAVVCRALSVRLSRRRRSRPVLSRAARQQLRVVQYQDDGFQPAARLRSARGFVAAAALFAVSDLGLAAADARTIVTTFSRTTLWVRVSIPTPAYINQVLGGVDPTGNVLPIGIPGCLGDGESSLPVRKELASGSTLTSLVGYTLNFNTLDNNKNPTDGLLLDFRQDFAGVGGDVTYLKTRVRRKILHAAGRRYRRVDSRSGRRADQDRQQRHPHARPFPDGTEPRPRLCPQRHRPARSDLLPLHRTSAMRWAAPNIGARRPSCRCRSGSCRRKSG